MDNNTFAICVVKLRPEISKHNPSVASILEKFSLNLLEQDRIVSELSDEQILKFKGVGPAALKAIRSIERGEGLQGVLDSISAISRPDWKDRSISGKQNIYYETKRLLQ